MSEDRAPYSTDSPQPAQDAQGGPQASAGPSAGHSPHDPLLTTAQAAAHVGKEYKAFTAWAHDYKVPKQGQGRQIKYLVSDLDAATSRQAMKGKKPLAVTEQAEQSPAELPPFVAALMADRERQNERLERLARENGRLSAELEQARQEIAQMGRQEIQEKPRSLWQRLFGRID